MPYNDLQSLLQSIFTQINADNNVSPPRQVWGIHQSQIQSLEAEFPDEFTLLGQGIHAPVAVEVARLLRNLRQRKTANDNGRQLTGRMRVELQPRQRPQRNVPANTLSAGERRIAALAPQLSSFSQFQIDGWAKLSDTINQRGGMVVLAPTGSGKTEVFLLPIVDAIAQSLRGSSTQEPPRFVLLYPRVPLLRDQLSRVFSAVYFARQRDRLSKPFIIGFQFGGVRANAIETLNARNIFARVDQNRNQFQVVENCPICQGGSQGRLVYGTSTSDPKGVSRLICTIDPSHWWHVSIARNDHMECQPHLLVTTAETLDRIYLNPAPKFEQYLCKITGIGFDEVHMYHGLYGVHIHNLVRRIEELSTQQLVKIASSATVANPASFAARLFYGDENRENEITVHHAEKGIYQTLLQPSGLEIIYFLQSPEGEKAPPPLSTLIQAEMAVGHALHSGSKRALTFVESLDVAGRLTTQLKDAERTGGLWRFRTLLSQIAFEGNACPGTEPLNCPTHYLKGECWRGVLGGANCCSPIDGLREIPLAINQVSSQNQSDFRDGNTVIATSILEVGVDDERIKTTIHYLPPRTVFSFIQRRGRAGRGNNDPVAYTIMVLGNEPSDQFYFFRRNRLLGGQFELPLNPSNVRVREMHDCLRDERNEMAGFITELHHIPNGAWRWVWEKLTRCTFLNSRYGSQFLVAGQSAEQQKRWVKSWVTTEHSKFRDRLNLRLRLRLLQQQLPNVLTSASSAMAAVESHLNGGATVDDVRSNLVSLKTDIITLLFDDSINDDLKTQLEYVDQRIYQLWDAIRQTNSNTSLSDAQRLHDFFRVLQKLFSEDWILFSPPDIIKIVLQSLFYLHLGMSEADEGPCTARMPFFVPDAYFQVVRPIVVEKREVVLSSLQYLESTEESITLLSNALIPYFTAYRYFGERLSTLDTEFVEKDVVQRVVHGANQDINRVILRLADPEGIQKGSMYEANKVGVRPLRTDPAGRGFVRMCPICFSLFDFDRTTPCDGRTPDVVKVMARPMVERDYSTTATRPISQQFDYLSEMEGKTTILGSEVEYQVYFQPNGEWVPLGKARKLEAHYEAPLYYSVPTRGLRWNLNNVVTMMINDSEVTQRFAEEVSPYRPDKQLTPEVVLHTAAHMLHKTISSISGVNEQELEYFCDVNNECVVVWERFEGGAGLIEVVRDTLRSKPNDFFQELLSTVICPIHLAETTELTDFATEKESLRQKWFFPSDSPFLDDVIGEAQAERQVIDSQQAQGQQTHDSCRAHDGCPVCVQITYCTQRRKQSSHISRLLGEVLLEHMICQIDRSDMEQLMVQSAQREIELPYMLRADMNSGVFDVLVL